MAKISVLGSGSWGMALALLLYNNGHEVLLWSARPEDARKLREKRENPDRLPGVQIPEDIEILTDLERAIKSADVTVLAVASPYIRSTAHKMAPFIRKGQKIVNVAKGIEEKTLKTLSDVIEEEIPEGDVAVLSGPSHAEEVGLQVPTAVVVGAKTFETASFVQRLFSNDYFRAYTSPDRKSIELGGSLKNVIALAAGIADGLGYGDNTEAALMTRGIKEITQLGVAMGGHSRTFHGLSGIGDLIVTCGSKHSRNRRAGILIGKGYTLDEAVKEVNMVVEGAVSAKAALELAHKYNVDMPLVESVNQVLFENKPAKEAMRDIMKRDLTHEFPDLVWE